MNIPSQSGLKVHSCHQPYIKLTELRYKCVEKKLGSRFSSCSFGLHENIQHTFSVL